MMRPGFIGSYPPVSIPSGDGPNNVLLAENNDFLQTEDGEYIELD
jgi:hypothetical protein